MDISISLTDVEVTALTVERLSEKEPFSDVLHRLVVPLVERLLTTQFSDLRTKYEALPLRDRVDILTTLQALSDARSK